MVTKIPIYAIISLSLIHILYSLILSAPEEKINQKVGIRTVCVKDGVILVNDRPIKFKGVNRHDSDPVTGYTISKEQALKDLCIMKEHNINAIRTSHYPNAPWFVQLCDEYGFYVIGESDIEMHGITSIYGGGADKNYSQFAMDQMCIRDSCQTAPRIGGTVLFGNTGK